VSAGDIVLVGLRDFQDDKCDIIHKVRVEALLLGAIESLLPQSIGLVRTLSSHTNCVDLC
jgi:hypothetical protein